MTNLERLRHLTTQEFALWMADIIDCSNCPCKDNDCPFDRKLCTQSIRKWLDADIATEYVSKQAVADLLLEVSDGYKYIEDDVHNLIRRVFELPSYIVKEKEER